jgi:hypothetical protein
MQKSQKASAVHCSGAQMALAAPVGKEPGRVQVGSRVRTGPLEEKLAHLYLPREFAQEPAVEGPDQVPAREPAASAARKRWEQSLAARGAAEARYTGHRLYTSRRLAATAFHNAYNGASFGYPVVDRLTTYVSSTEPACHCCRLQSFLISRVALRRVSLHPYGP